ncbi:muts domain V-domain-containing protein [Hyaloraphidium curvatum]|nr:muts domain V-domain-containing protein [Hyaloraphidium curvatum]
MLAGNGPSAGDAGGRNAPEFDKKEQLGFCSFFAGLPEPEPNSIRLFERGGGEWYSFHGPDALYVAQNVYKTTTALKYWGSEGGSVRPLPICTLSRSNTEVFVRDLLVQKQHRVEIWQPAGKNQWRVGKRASPGNLGELEDFLFSETEISVDPVVAAVKLSTKGDQKLVGVGFADASARKLGCCEFVDNDLYSNFESMLIQINAKELVVPSDEGQAYDLNKLKQAADRCGCVVTLKKKSDFSGKDVEQDLSRLLPEENVATLPQFELRLAIDAVGCLVKYLGLMGEESNFGQFSISTHDLTQYVRLDAAAVRSLNLAPSPGDSTKTVSLFSLLNNCKTSQGTRLLSQYIKQPLVSVPEILERQDLVEALVIDQHLRQTLQERHLKLFPDLHRIGKKFQRGKAKLEDVVRIYQVVCHLPGLKDALLQYDSGVEGDPMVTDDDKSARLSELIHAKWVMEVSEISGQLDKFRELVEATIDLEAIDRHEFLIRATYDSTLEELKERMDEAQAEMDPELNRVSRDLDTGKSKGGVKLENRQPYGYHFRLAKSESAAIRNDKRYIELTTQKAGVLFTTKKLQELEKRYREASEEYEAKQTTLAADVIDVAASYFGVLERLNAVIANLDVICSFAQATVTAPTQWIRPKIHATGAPKAQIVLSNLRHPLLETTTDYIPNDVTLLPERSSFQIITGPNMGGKSTFIRSVAIAVIMAQMGCFVPADAEGAEIGCVDAVYCRVGAGDNQMRGASTFMMEMIETATILKSSTKNSLIVIDELGRGTSTYDGFGLAYAISQHIANQIRCYCLFATHFHELTVLGDEIPTVKNLNVTAHVGNGQLTLLYKVKEGVCDQSFGIHVAELAQFPDSVVRLAKKKAAELEDFSAKGDGTHVQRVWNSTKDEIEEGTNIIRSFLEEFSALGNPMDLDDSDVAASLDALKEKYRDAVDSNAFVREVLAEL